MSNKEELKGVHTTDIPGILEIVGLDEKVYETPAKGYEIVNTEQLRKLLDINRKYKQVNAELSKELEEAIRSLMDLTNVLGINQDLSFAKRMQSVAKVMRNPDKFQKELEPLLKLIEKYAEIAQD